MQSKHRVRRTWTAAATLVVTGLAVLAMGCAAAVAREPSSAGTPAPNASAGLLARGAGYDEVTGSQRVRALQSKLRRLNHDPGPIDGLYGPRTEGAVRAFQQSRGLAIDGIVGRATAAALRHASRGVAQSGGGRQTAGVSTAGSRTPGRRPLQAGQRRGAREPAARPTRTAPEADTGSVKALLAALALALGALVALVALTVALRRQPRRPAKPTSLVSASRARLGALKRRIQVIVARVRRSRSAGRRRRTTWVVRLGALRGRIGAIRSRVLRSRSGGRSSTNALPADVAGRLSSRADPGSDRPVERRAATNNGGPPKRRAGEAPLWALGYLGGDTASELGAQAEQIEQLCERRGWTLVELVRAGEANGDGTPASSGALEHALERLRGGEVSALVVAQLEPVCRAAGGRETLVERLDQVGARLVCVEPALDTGAGPAARERLSRRQLVGASRPGEKVGLECFQLGRVRGRSEAVWQYTAVDYASGYAWAELRISDREARTEHLREFVQRVARELRAAGWRLESVSSDNASGLSTGRVRGEADRPGARRRIGGGQPSSNGNVERLQRKIIAECWRPALARSREGGLSALQRQLDDYLETYNQTETSGLSRGRVPEEVLDNGVRNGSSEHSANGSGRTVGHDRATRP